ncbi:ATP-binding protein (plasmid) [Aliirhizobium terrae]|uniref:ATP-binding protein n=1 Tax=Terrirhizobium terrae TaxID=2926709 RepID=UPI0025768B20|nr:ATP-binding protein [Rhizobium sp. CC-CFT758]WJH38349.1 ATP-binding protein [Rhizobium sp. CC-CFT758]
MKLERPIAARITRIVLSAVATGISVSVGVFLVSDFRQAMRAEASRYQSAAFAFAAASSDGVAERDVRKVLEVIRGVRNLPEVTYIAASDQEDRVIAEIGAGARLVKQSDFWWTVPTTIEVLADVQKSGARVGSVVMRADAHGVVDRYLSAAFYAALLGVVLVGTTAIIARRQVGKVVRPLQELSEQFIDIGKRSDLRRRLKKERNDEVGVLVDAFNKMFGHIDERDRQLQRHRETLEETVEARTVELRVAKDEADAANAAKSTFLATMSHEIRTPMNGMMVMAEMLSAAPLSPRHQRYAEIITRSGKNLVHIINDILDFSKIESGRIELEEIAFSLDAVIEDVASLFAERAREKDLSLGIYISPDVPITVLGDPVRLTQVVSNLVNNGLKFTEAGGVSISVKMDTESDRLTIAVADTGIGVDPDQVGRIFTRFSQADSSITRKFGGTGLGLSISKQLTELMGGAIHVESQVGRGSEFIVTIPVETIEQASPVMSHRALSVALYDDDGVSRRAVTQALEARGVRVVNTASEDCDAILIRSGGSCDLSDISSAAPVVLLRPFAATSVPMPSGLKVVAEVPLPVSRMLIDHLCRAMEERNLSSLNLASHSSTLSTVPDLRHLKALAVDDVAVNREVLAEALRTFNIQCDLAETGSEAIAQVRSKTYDVIFMDCSMPGMDGFEATRAIRDLEMDVGRRPAVVVALTGHVMGRDGGEWKDAGMNGFLSKPFSIGQLTAILRDLDNVDLGPEDEAADDEPLLSSETLTMFDSIHASTGTDIRSKVFTMFSAEALDAYRLAIAEIQSHGDDAKRLVHVLKSNCTSAGAAKAGSICQEIETTLALGDTPPQARLEELERVLLATLVAMQSIGSTMEVSAA